MATKTDSRVRRDAQESASYFLAQHSRISDPCQRARRALMGYAGGRRWLRVEEYAVAAGATSEQAEQAGREDQQRQERCAARRIAAHARHPFNVYLIRNGYAWHLTLTTVDTIPGGAVVYAGGRRIVMPRGLVQAGIMRTALGMALCPRS